MTGESKQTRNRGILLLAVVVLALLGVADGWYLTIVHVDYELGWNSELVAVCKELTAAGCSITAGRYGKLLDIPISLWGMGGASATALTAAVAVRQRKRAHDPWRGTAFLLASFSVLASLAMAMVSASQGSFCPFCVAWYGLNFAQGLCAWLALGDLQVRSAGRFARDLLGPTGVAALLAFGMGLSLGYWAYGTHRAELRAKMDEDTEAMLEAIIASGKTVKIDLTGLPTKGPQDATLTVVEVADFQCPHCRRLWENLGAYLKDTPWSVRVAFIHYPLDDSCNTGVQSIHPVACAAAKAAECARRHEKFFEYGDLLFANQPDFEPDALVGYAEELGMPADEFRRCLDDPAAEVEVRRSIARAILLDVSATPTFYVNGIEFKGARPLDWIELVFDKLARRAQGGTRDGAAAP